VLHQAARSPAEGIISDFNGVELPDRYVFGFGMDYHEQAATCRPSMR
jgi:hypoxanthine-guanine phosphoribosyltransferase